MVSGGDRLSGFPPRAYAQLFLPTRHAARACSAGGPLPRGDANDADAARPSPADRCAMGPRATCLAAPARRPRKALYSRSPRPARCAGLCYRTVTPASEDHDPSETRDPFLGSDRWMDNDIARGYGVKNIFDDASRARASPFFASALDRIAKAQDPLVDKI
jgi:hypothetical protein